MEICLLHRLRDFRYLKTLCQQWYRQTECHVILGTQACHPISARYGCEGRKQLTIIPLSPANLSREGGIPTLPNLNVLI